MTGITIINTAIRQDAHGRYSLNDLHRAASGAEKHKPANFLRAAGVQAFVAALNAENPAVSPVASVPGRKGGIYAAELVVYRYAAWISAAFGVQVRSAFRDPATGQCWSRAESAPQKAVRLTDEQIDKIESDCWSGPGLGATFNREGFARDIEDAVLRANGLEQDITDAAQNAMRNVTGATLALPAPDAPQLLDMVEIAKAAGIDLPLHLCHAAGKYVKARVMHIETERIIAGSIRKSAAYYDHAAVADALREYLGKRTASQSMLTTEV